METTNINSEESKFVQKALKFCKAVDKYSATLGLDANEITAFKGDINVLAYISWHYPSFSPSFVQYNIVQLRARFDEICDTCRRSARYNRHIGMDLGIEPVYHERNLYSEYLGAWFDEAQQARKIRV